MSKSSRRLSRLAARIGVPALLTLLAFVATDREQALRAPHDDLPSARTLAAALDTARESGRLVALDFTSDAAPCSATLRAETWCDPLVRGELASAFVHLELDATREQTLFRELLGSSGSLASCVLDASGEVVAELPGFADARAYADQLARARRGAPEVEAARELVALAGDDALAWGRLALARERAGNPRLAATAWQRVLGCPDAGPDDVARACERLARRAAEQGENRPARELLARVRATGDAELDARVDLTQGLILVLERSPRLALAPLGRALELASEPGERRLALFALADAQRDAGEPRAALATFARLLEAEFDPLTRARARDAIVALRTNAHGHVH